MKLPKPNKKGIIYTDDKLYVVLANRPLTRGHVVIVWKDDVSDLHLLSRENYEHLMNMVDKVRTAMLKTLDIEKIYLVYADETQHVHWHLIPRYEEKGLNILLHEPGRLKDTSLAAKIKKNI